MSLSSIKQGSSVDLSGLASAAGKDAINAQIATKEAELAGLEARENTGSQETTQRVQGGAGGETVEVKQKSGGKEDVSAERGSVQSQLNNLRNELSNIRDKEKPESNTTAKNGKPEGAKQDEDRVVGNSNQTFASNQTGTQQGQNEQEKSKKVAV